MHVNNHSMPFGQPLFMCIHCGLLPSSLARIRWVNVRFARKNSPEMLRASHRTTTIFWPLRSCLATVLARRPSKWPLPSMTWVRCQREAPWKAACALVLTRGAGWHGDQVQPPALEICGFVYSGRTYNDGFEGRHFARLRCAVRLVVVKKELVAADSNTTTRLSEYFHWCVCGPCAT